LLKITTRSVAKARNTKSHHRNSKHRNKDYHGDLAWDFVLPETPIPWSRRPTARNVVINALCRAVLVSAEHHKKYTPISVNEKH
jgi:hypothetical protein